MTHPLPVNSDVYYLKLEKYSKPEYKILKCKYCDFQLDKIKGCSWDRRSMYATKCNNNRYSHSFGYYSTIPIYKREIVIVKSIIIKSRIINAHDKIKYEYTIEGISRKCIFPRDSKTVFFTESDAIEKVNEIKEITDFDSVIKSIYEKRKKHINTYCFDVRSNVIFK